MTKSFTALSILKLRDEGRLSLEDPAEKYVPEMKALTYPTDDSPRITIRHLLSHAEGFPEDNPWGDQQLSATDEMLDEWLEKGIPFSTPPGTRYEYSNYAFGLLGRIVARASGLPYETYMREEILAPLSMTGTTFEFSRIPPASRAIGYRLKPEALAVKINGKHISEIALLSIAGARDWFAAIPKKLTAKQNEIAARMTCSSSASAKTTRLGKRRTRS